MSQAAPVTVSVEAAPRGAAQFPARPSVPRRVARALGRVVSLVLWALVVALFALVVAGLVSKAVMGSGQPVVFGWSCASVLTGSMEPQIEPGDLVVSREQESYAVGDVVTYLTETGSSVTHRVVAVSDEGLLTTRGDANNVDDSQPVEPANVVGAVVLVLPGVGLVLNWLATPTGAGAVALLVVALFLLCWAVSGGKGKHDADPAEKPAGRAAAAEACAAVGSAFATAACGAVDPAPAAVAADPEPAPAHAAGRVFVEEAGYVPAHRAATASDEREEVSACCSD
jgi:signal peptidase